MLTVCFASLRRLDQAVGVVLPLDRANRTVFRGIVRDEWIAARNQSEHMRYRLVAVE